jgi:hypothetical protein
MSELQGSPLEESVPKMVDGKLKCTDGYALKLSDAYRAKDDETDKKNASSKKEKNGYIGGLIVFIILSILLAVVFRLNTSYSLINRYGSTVRVGMTREEIWETMKKLPKTFSFILFLFLGSLIGIITMS